MEQEQQEEKKISKHEFYFETPLYEVIEVGRLESDLFKNDVDAYNSASGFDTTYKIELDRVSDHEWSSYYHFYKILQQFSKAYHPL